MAWAWLIVGFGGAIVGACLVAAALAIGSVGVAALLLRKRTRDEVDRECRQARGDMPELNLGNIHRRRLP